MCSGAVGDGRMCEASFVQPGLACFSNGRPTFMVQASPPPQPISLIKGYQENVASRKLLDPAGTLAAGGKKPRHVSHDHPPRIGHDTKVVELEVRRAKFLKNLLTRGLSNSPMIESCGWRLLTLSRLGFLDGDDEASLPKKRQGNQRTGHSRVEVHRCAARQFKPDEPARAAARLRDFSPAPGRARRIGAR